jgi:hypothetical protein
MRKGGPWALLGVPAFTYRTRRFPIHFVRLQVGVLRESR